MSSAACSTSAAYCNTVAVDFSISNNNRIGCTEKFKPAKMNQMEKNEYIRLDVFIPWERLLSSLNTEQLTSEEPHAQDRHHLHT
jgi:hypothetical protein